MTHFQSCTLLVFLKHDSVSSNMGKEHVSLEVPLGVVSLLRHQTTFLCDSTMCKFLWWGQSGSTFQRSALYELYRNESAGSCHHNHRLQKLQGNQSNEGVQLCQLLLSDSGRRHTRSGQGTKWQRRAASAVVSFSSLISQGH